MLRPALHYPREIWKRRFRSENASHQVFSVHTTPEGFENATVVAHFGFVLEDNSGREITWLLQPHRFRICFLLHENAKPAFSNSSGLKSVFEKLRFRDGSVWTVGLTVEMKLRFQILPASCGRRLMLQVTFCRIFESFYNKELSLNFTVKRIYLHILMDHILLNRAIN